MVNESFMAIGFIGPGGPEFLVVMVVLLLMFGAKDAPRIFRKLNEMINSVRNTADGFKREIMYGDLNADPSTSEDAYEEDSYYDEMYHDEDHDLIDEEVERDYSDETFQNLEKDLEHIEPAEEAEPVATTEEDGEGDDARKD